MMFRLLIAVIAITTISMGAAWKPEAATFDAMPISGPTSQPIGHYDCHSGSYFAFVLEWR